MAKRKRKSPVRLTKAEIREFREASGLNQSECGELVGVSRITWNMWESGKRNPSPQAAILLRRLIDEKKS